MRFPPAALLPVRLLRDPALEPCLYLLPVPCLTLRASFPLAWCWARRQLLGGSGVLGAWG